MLVDVSVDFPGDPVRVSRGLERTNKKEERDGIMYISSKPVQFQQVLLKGYVIPLFFFYD